MTISTAIYQRRRALGMTQRMAAKAIGVCVETFRSWEKGEFRPAIRNIPVIAAVLHCDVEEILEGNEQQRPEIPPYCEEIVQRRLKLGLTQGQLAQRSGVSVNTVYKMERGIQVPHWETRQKLRNALNLPEERYFSKEERNALLLEMDNCVGWVIQQNRAKFHAVNADMEDVYQELTLCALRAIDRYNPEFGTTVQHFVIHTMLGYSKEILCNYRRHGLAGHTADYIDIGTVISLDAMLAGGAQI